MRYARMHVKNAYHEFQTFNHLCSSSMMYVEWIHRGLKSPVQLHHDQIET